MGQAEQSGLSDPTEQTQPAAPWWQRAVVYQIYPRSFCDSNGDGVGDLEGIRRHLDHLAWLGVDAIWLSPFFRSPMRDYGYDVEDYCDVDPLFGSLADFDHLLAEAHARGLRVLIDWVPNHTSDRHPWFQDARRARDSAHRDWYLWRDGSPEKPPNNWRAAFAPEPAWTWDDTTEQWYLHLFLKEQPDLNWRNPEVVAAMHDTLRFWLDRGVDGFRMDVVHCIGKDEGLPDFPAERAAIPACALNDCEHTHALLQGIRAVLDEYPGERVAVGEVVLLKTEWLAPYTGDGDELHLVFNFLPLHAGWSAARWRERIDEAFEHLDGDHGWPTWVLSNHDNPRHRTRYGGSEARARAAAVLLLCLRGTPFLYAGEELGLEDAEIREEARLDPGGRDGCRAPIPWTADPGHGWATGGAWLPWPPEVATRNVASQRSDSASILALYRRLLRARRASPALARGRFDWRPGPEGALLFERRHGEDRRAVLVGFDDAPESCELPGRWRIAIASDGRGEGQLFDGRLGPDRALVLEPSSA